MSRQRLLRPGRQYNKNPMIFKATLAAIKSIESRKMKPAFNTLREELGRFGVIANDSSLRSYLDLLVGSGVLKIRIEKIDQPNIYPRHIYSLAKTKPLVEGGERSLLFHGLNWVVSSPHSIKLETDFLGLARSTFTPEAVFASLEDSIAEELSRKCPAALVFSTALLSTEKIDVEYLLHRARERGTAQVLLALLSLIERTFTSSNPEIHDVKALYKLRERYHKLHRPPISKIAGQSHKVSNLPTENDVLEYASKQLGIGG